MKAKKQARRRAASAGTSGCKYVVEWKQLTTLTGYTQVWVPTAAYDKAAKQFIKREKSRYGKTLLRRRMAPLGVTHVCKGTCGGGWCKEVQHPGGAFLCECSYFV